MGPRNFIQFNYKNNTSIRNFSPPSPHGFGEKKIIFEISSQIYYIKSLIVVFFVVVFFVVASAGLQCQKVTVHIESPILLNNRIESIFVHHFPSRVHTYPGQFCRSGFSS